MARYLVVDSDTEGEITELWAWVAVDETGEGIAGELIGGNWFTFVTSKERLARKIRPVVETLQKQTGKKFRLLKFTTRTVIEDID